MGTFSFWRTATFSSELSSFAITHLYKNVKNCQICQTNCQIFHVHGKEHRSHVPRLPKSNQSVTGGHLLAVLFFSSVYNIHILWKHLNIWKVIRDPPWDTILTRIWTSYSRPRSKHRFDFEGSNRDVYISWTGHHLTILVLPIFSSSIFHSAQHQINWLANVMPVTHDHFNGITANLGPCDRYYTISCNNTQYHNIQGNAMQYSTILFNAMQFHAIPYDMIKSTSKLYNLMLFFVICMSKVDIRGFSHHQGSSARSRRLLKHTKYKY